MKHLAAYLLLNLGGTASPSAEDITNVLSSVGAEVDKDRVSKLLSELNGKDISELIAEGASKLASVPSGASAGGSASSGGGAATAGGDAPTEEKEEKDEEESDEDMGFGLFD